MSMRKVGKILRVMILGLWPFMGAAQAIAEDHGVFSCVDKKKIKNGLEIVRKSQSAYQAVSGLSAQFEQNSILLGMADTFKSSGSLKFLRPGKMNWEYTAPKIQKFVSNGETVWFYEPDVNQVTVGKLSKTFDSQVPVSFLLGVGDLEQSFDAKEVCIGPDGIILKLNSKVEQPNLKSFSLLLDPKTYLPIGARIVDAGDTSTEFIFKDLKQETMQDDSLFTFEPPSGVDIVNH